MKFWIWEVFGFFRFYSERAAVRFHVISFRGSCIMPEVQRADGLIRTESFTFAQFDTIQQKGLQLN